MAQHLTPLQAMRIALEEGRKGWGRVHPNPQVGCVILNSQNELLAKGYHGYFGGPHAEVDALGKITDKAAIKGCKVFVTLEPCAHEGKTPSCAKMLAGLPASEVIYGGVDPHPLVARKGIEILESAGIKVRSIVELINEQGEPADRQELPELVFALEALAEHFLWNQRRQLPFVALKVATTLDGVLAHRSGESKWITGEGAREEVHRLRAGFAAVMVGKNTFLRDDPSLNVRHPDFINTVNKAIVLDSKGEGLTRLKGSNLLKSHKPENIFWVVSDRAGLEKKAAQAGVQLIAGPVEQALSELYSRGIDSILVEGGARAHSYFLKHKLAQRLYQFIAPQIAGSLDGIPWTSQVAFAWNSKPKLRGPAVSRYGEDILISGRLDEPI